MKFNKIGQVSMVSAIAFVLAGSFTACNPVTIDYIFAAGNKADPGQIQTFLVDRVSGALEARGTTVSSGGVTPVSGAVSVDESHMYIANQGSNSIVEFAISGSGILTAGTTTSLTPGGNTPVSVVMNYAGTLLYVINKFQPGCATATTGASSCNGGALVVLPVGTGGTLGTPVANGSLGYFPVGINPTAVNALENGAGVYVSTYDPTAGLGYLYGFSATSAGALTSLGTPVLAGVKPAAVASVPTSRFLYVTDFSQNELIAYSLQDTTHLHPLINGPFKTGNEPSSIVVDPRGEYIYITNQLDNTVSAYAIDQATGTPTVDVSSASTSGNATGTSPLAILVDPAFGRFVYTANSLDDSISGFELNAITGVLTATQNGPYPTVGQPVVLLGIAHGNHSIQQPQP